MDREIFLNNLYEYNNIYIDKVFVEYEGTDIVFTCTDGKNKFLAICIDFREKLEWIVSKINDETLGNIHYKNQDLRNVFLDSSERYYVSYDGIQWVKNKNVEEWMLPELGSYIEGNNINCEIKYDLNTYSANNKYVINDFVSNTQIQEFFDIEYKTFVYNELKYCNCDEIIFCTSSDNNQYMNSFINSSSERNFAA